MKLATKKINWDFIPIRELAETCSGSTPPRGRKEYFGGGIPWVKTGDLTDGIISITDETVSALAIEECNLRILPPGTLLIAMYGQGQTRGRTALLNCEATINQACFAILPNHRFIPEFLQYWFRHSYERLRRISEGRGGNQSNFNGEVLRAELVPVPDRDIQRQITSSLRQQLSEVECAQSLIEEQLSNARRIEAALLRESLAKASPRSLNDCLVEVTSGIGDRWPRYKVLGATRSGAAPAKDAIGKNPQRYKLVKPGTIFYNPMRILLGSIAMVDDGEPPGITSPDYVVMNTRDGLLHPVWFYHWFRSKYGEEFIKSLSRGAVRERLLFKRLALAMVPIPDWSAQLRFCTHIAEVKIINRELKTRHDSITILSGLLLRKVFHEIN